MFITDRDVKKMSWVNDNADEIFEMHFEGFRMLESDKNRITNFLNIYWA